MSSRSKDKKGKRKVRGGQTTIMFIAPFQEDE